MKIDKEFLKNSFKAIRDEETRYFNECVSVVLTAAQTAIADMRQTGSGSAKASITFSNPGLKDTKIDWTNVIRDSALELHPWFGLHYAIPPHNVYQKGTQASIEITMGRGEIDE